MLPNTAEPGAVRRRTGRPQLRRARRAGAAAPSAVRDMIDDIARFVDGRNERYHPLHLDQGRRHHHRRYQRRSTSGTRHQAHLTG